MHLVASIRVLLIGLVIKSIILVYGNRDVVFPVLQDIPSDAIQLASSTVTRPMQCGVLCAQRSDCCFTRLHPAQDGLHTCVLYKQNGAYCHAKRGKNVYASCSEALTSTGAKEGQFSIAVPLNNPSSRDIPVLCRMTNGESFAVFDHYSNASVKWSGPTDTVHHDITYINSIADILLLMDNSGDCKQHLALQCHNSAIHPNRKAVWFTVTESATRSYYPSSLPTDDLNCHCDASHDCCCGTNRAACDCDVKDGTLRSGDFGYFTRKERLPIARFEFHDVDTIDNFGFFSLGPLLCKN